MHKHKVAKIQTHNKCIMDLRAVNYKMLKIDKRAHARATSPIWRGSALPTPMTPMGVSHCFRKVGTIRT